MLREESVSVYVDPSVAREFEEFSHDKRLFFVPKFWEISDLRILSCYTTFNSSQSQSEIALEEPVSHLWHLILMSPVPCGIRNQICIQCVPWTP